MASITQSGSSKLKKKRFKPRYQKAKLFRANEPLLSVFMWGINHTIHELTHVNVPCVLLPDDFKAFSKTKVDNHHFNKESMPSHFKVKEYCPLVFKILREHFNIPDIDYMQSLTKSQPTVVSPGRSGMKFYQSYNHLFVMKVLQTEEVEQMHSLLKEYYPYVVKRHGKTLLPQYLGMYRLTVEGAETYIVVIRNIFSSNLKIHKKYDLKGSTLDRDASDKEKEKDIPTLKDNDFIKDGRKMYVTEEDKERIIETLTSDVEFLSSMNLMDYSLCLGIHDSEKAAEEAKEDPAATGSKDEKSSNEENEPLSEEYDSGGSAGGGPGTPPDSPHAAREGSFTINTARDIYAIVSAENAPKKEIYFMGLIDILTHYGMKKRTAQAAKTVKHGTNAEISTVHPEQYAKRLTEFIVKAMEKD